MLSGEKRQVPTQFSCLARKMEVLGLLGPRAIRISEALGERATGALDSTMPFIWEREEYQFPNRVWQGYLTRELFALWNKRML